MRNYIEETKKCLVTYKECSTRLESKIIMLENIVSYRKRRTEGTGLTGIQYDGIQCRTNKVSSKVEDIAVKNIQMEMELVEEIDALDYYLKRINIKIEELKPEWKEVLTVKYIEGNTWDYTALKVGLSEATCRRYAKKAVDALADRLMGQKSYIDLPLFRDIYIDDAACIS